jgi:hypothetical protein
MITAVGVVNTAKYETTTDVWSLVTKIPSHRGGSTSGQNGAGAAATLRDTIFVCGAEEPPQGKNVEAYSAPTDSWTTKKAMPAAHSGLAVAASATQLFVAAGFFNLLTMHIYDAATDSWANGVLSTSCRLLAACMVDVVIVGRS